MRERAETLLLLPCELFAFGIHLGVIIRWAGGEQEQSWFPPNLFLG